MPVRANAWRGGTAHVPLAVRPRSVHVRWNMALPPRTCAVLHQECTARKPEDGAWMRQARHAGSVDARAQRCGVPGRQAGQKMRHGFSSGGRQQIGPKIGPKTGPKSGPKTGPKKRRGFFRAGGRKSAAKSAVKSAVENAVDLAGIWRGFFRARQGFFSWCAQKGKSGAKNSRHGCAKTKTKYSCHAFFGFPGPFPGRFPARFGRVLWPVFGPFFGPFSGPFSCPVFGRVFCLRLCTFQVKLSLSPAELGLDSKPAQGRL